MTKQELREHIEELKYGYLVEKKSTVALEKEFNICSASIRKVLIEFNVPLRTKSEAQRKYALDEHILDVIDTEEKAYFLGFFYADGYNAKYKREITITLNEDDEDILQAFKTLFSYSGEIKRHPEKLNSNGYMIRPTVELSIGSTYLTKKLEELGAPQNKSFVIEFPTWLPKDLYRHFIRGYFDGDGCITWRRGCSKQLGSHFIVNEKFSQGLQEVLKNEGFETIEHSITTNNCDSRIKKLNLRGAGSKPFLDWIYTDSKIKCTRKYNRYYSFYYEGKPISPYKIPRGKVIQKD